MNRFKEYLSSLLLSIGRQPISAAQWIIGASGILIIRFFLENFSSSAVSGIIASDAPTLVHYWLFFVTVSLATCWLISYFLPEYSKQLYKYMLFGLVVTWIAPLIDLASGNKMAYIFDGSTKALLVDFCTFFGPFVDRGISLGIRIELGCILLGIFGAVYALRKSLWRAVAAAFSLYVLMFFFVALPSIVYIFHMSVSSDGAQFLFGSAVMNYFAMSDGASLIGSHFLHQSISFVTQTRSIEIYFDVAMADLLYFLGIVSAALYVARAFPGKITLLLKNSRPERIIHFLVLSAAGMIAAQSSVFSRGIEWQDIATIFIVFISYYFAWMFAVGVNDIEDIEIDIVSNADRPFTRGALSESDMRSANAFFLAASLIGGFLAGHYAFYCLLVFTSAYYIYSAAPLRLKRVPVLSTFLIAVASLSAAVAGFFTLNDDPTFSAFALPWALLILVAFTLIINVKDIKDIDGDTKAGVPTIPVIFGAKQGKHITGGLFALAFLLVPIVFDRPALLTISIPAACLGYWLVNRQAYKEIYAFILYFSYLGVLGILMLLGFF
jgi:4-hydroxybenzoate polyprenyltransferase